MLFRRYEDEAYLKEKSGIKLEWQDRKGSEVKDLPFEKAMLQTKLLIQISDFNLDF